MRRKKWTSNNRGSSDPDLNYPRNNGGLNLFVEAARLTSAAATEQIKKRQVQRRGNFLVLRTPRNLTQPDYKLR